MGVGRQRCGGCGTRFGDVVGAGRIHMLALGSRAFSLFLSDFEPLVSAVLAFVGVLELLHAIEDSPVYRNYALP